LGICKAYQIIRHRIKTPLVVIGSGGAYKEAVKAYIKTHQLEDLIIFLSDQTAAKNSTNFQNAVDFPAIYQQAKAMIYPSIFEGFGIPVLEALWSKIPVITSNISCLPEAGGDGAFYVDPYQPEEIASQLEKICSDSDLVQKNVEIGWKHAQKFSSFQTASAVMNLYRSLL
jgi:glycosyltransferase involved in cell wall biosynthesis